MGEKYTHKITFLNHHEACKHLSHQKFKLGEHPGLWVKAKGKYNERPKLRLHEVLSHGLLVFITDISHDMPALVSQIIQYNAQQKQP